MEDKSTKNHYGALYPVYPSYVYTGDNCTVYLETGSCLPYTLELWGERTFQDRGVHSTFLRKERKRTHRSFCFRRMQENDAFRM